MSGSRTTHEISRTVLRCAIAVLALQTVWALDPNRTIGQYIVTRWGPDSFPGGAINAIAQTPDGYLWIGAENGLVRFDGINFRLFDHTDSPTLPPSPVLGLVVDSDGDLWVRMQSPYLLRYRSGTFEQMYPEKVPPEFTFAREQGASAAARGTLGNVLIVTPESSLRYAAGKFVAMDTPGAMHGIPTSIAETSDGALWIGMRDSGLYCVRNGRGSPAGLRDQKVNALLPAPGSKLWIGTDSGLVQWDGESITRRGVPAALAAGVVLALGRDRDANLWVSTSAGITRMDAKGSAALKAGGNSLGAVRAIFEDREGNVWLGGTAGLEQLRDTPFLSYSGIADGGASTYVDSSGRAWIAPSAGGLLWIRGGERRSIPLPGAPRDVVYSITGGPGEVWVGRRLGGVTQFREEGGVVRDARSFTMRDGLARGVVDALHRARDGSVWVGTLSGEVSRIEKGRVTTFTTADGLSTDAVTTIQETRDGTIWVGTAGGLQAFRAGKWRAYSAAEGLPPGRVNRLALDGDGVLWIGTYSGLLYWSGAEFESPRNIPAALQREIYGLAADDAGNLWAVTDRHVLSVSRTSLRSQSSEPVAVHEFGIADGLPSTRGVRRDGSVVKDSAGKIWIALHGGIGVVDPTVTSAPAAVLVKVESVTVDGRTSGAASVVRYPSSRQRVVFHFIGMNLAAPGRVRYRYRLDGYDTDWSQPTEAREASYTSLSPANYTFRVMASNADGLWNGAAATIPVVVDPRLSETWWFRVSGLCLAGLALVGGVRYRLRLAHASMNLRFEERLAERTRIARELHDTLLQSFQGLMLRLQLVDNLLPPGEAKEQLEQSLERADQAIAEGRDAVYDLRSSVTNTNDLAEALRALGAELSAHTSTSFQLVVEGSARDLHPIIRDEFYRIAREALRNAFGHAKADHIETELTYGQRVLRLRVRDDGQGIPAELLEGGRRGHYGLSGMRERAKQMGAKLEIWSGARAGTEIELSIAGSLAYRAPAGWPKFQVFRKKAGYP